jgi:hypothetical protein
MSRGEGGRLRAAALMMLDAIRRFFGDFRPADWTLCLLEIIFVGVILWLDLPERFHRNKVRRRLRFVHARIADGQRLHESAPPAGTTDIALVDPWIGAVRQWIDQTNEALSKYSVAAGLSFNSRKVAPDVIFNGVTGTSNARGWYGELLHRLSNLQNIMEKAEVYF